MKNENKYDKLVKALKDNNPRLSDKDALVEEIMGKITKPEYKIKSQEKMLDYLFGWAGIYWLRGSLAAIATIFVGVFIFQQLTIANRLSSLENQLVNTVNVINNLEPELGITQKVFLKMINSKEDSITVSKSDLEKMMNSYLELQKNNEEIKLNKSDDPLMHRGLKKKPVKNVTGNES